VNPKRIVIMGGAAGFFAAIAGLAMTQW